MAEGDWPKIDGNIFYASEANSSIFGRKGDTGAIGSVWIGSPGAVIRGANSNRYTLLVTNNQSGTVVFIGPSGTSNTNGFPLGYGLTHEFQDTGSVFGLIGSIAGAGSADIRFIEVEK